MAFALLLGLALVLVATLWLRPGLLLNESSARWAARRWLPETKLTWTKFDWRFSPRGALGKRSELSIADLCFANESAHGCLDRIHLDLSFTLRKLRPQLMEIKHVIAHGRDVAIHPAESAQEPEPREIPLPDLRLPALSSMIAKEIDFSVLQNLSLRLMRIRVNQPGEPEIRAAISLDKEPSSPSELRLRTQWRAEKPGRNGFRTRGSLKASLTADSLRWQGEVLGKTKDFQVAAPLRGAWSDELRLEATPRLRTGGRSYSPAVNLRWSAAELALDLGKFDVPEAWPGRNVTVRNCSLRSRLEESRGFPRRGALNCIARARAVKPGNLVPTLDASGTLSFEARVLRTDRIAVAVDLRARTEQEVFRGDISGAGQLEFGGPSFELREISEPSFAARLNVPSFRKLSATLETAGYAIPAPLHVLEGPASLTLDLAEGSTEKNLKLLAHLDTNLTSQNQRLATSTLATMQVAEPLSPKRSMSLDVKLRLRDVQLEAPPLRLAEPPQFTPDQRITTAAEARAAPVAKEAKGEEMPVRWSLSVESDRPVRVVTNLQQHPIPASIQLAIAGESSPDGVIEINPMPIRIFRRNAQVEHVRLLFREASEKVGLDGLITYRNPEATVRILLLGSTAEPRVEFQSDPPLNRQQIISLLLFNKSIAELTEEEAQSAGATSQALAQGAFGIFSLLFLSSTPIESVGYDPITGAYTVRLRLSNRTTVSLASDLEESRQLGLRHRLGTRWAIRTELQQAEERENSLLTLLEWFRRF